MATELTTDEKLAVLAKAILELARKAATTHDYDGEQMVSEGVFLELERELDAIAECRAPKPSPPPSLIHR